MHPDSKELPARPIAAALQEGSARLSIASAVGALRAWLRSHFAAPVGTATLSGRSAALTGIGVLAVLLGGTFLIMFVTVEALLYRDIENVSQNMAKHLSEHGTDLHRIVAGSEPSERLEPLVKEALHGSGVFRFKIFDVAGSLRMTSDELGADRPTLDQHNPVAGDVLKTGIAHIEVKRGSTPDQPARYAEAYVPVMVDAKIVAVLEAYVDQTDKYSDLWRYFLLATVSLVALVAIAFCLPAWAFYRRTIQKQAADQQVRFLAHHDPLTHLANRAWFLERLHEALAKARRSGTSVAVHYLDLDRFKQINDTLGHETGDKLLKGFGDRLRSIVRTDDLLARLGGDEFAIAQVSLSDRGDAGDLARRLQQALAEPIAVGDHEIQISSSIGIAVSPDDGTGPLGLLKSADLALYAAKALGRQRHCFFDPAMQAELEKRLTLERLIREATASQDFELHFQPLNDGAAHRICGFEALLRLRQADGTFIPPAEFIPVAEEIGLISTIGAWVINKACMAATTWPEHFTIAVNLSPAQFSDGQIVGLVREALVRSGLPPGRLELEITEGLLLADTEGTLEQLTRLKNLGVRIVMDDFGTGYSSLSYLWKFPFSKIKMDGSFMSALAVDEHVASILRTIVDLGRSLNMPVTAEGVETEDQVKFLDGIACDQLQGFYFGRPMPEWEVAGAILRDLEQGIRTPEPGAR